MTSNALQARPEAAHGELESVIQLNAVVVNNIPKQYTHVVLEMCEAERKSIIWRSTLVTVAKGTATFNFWARFVTKRKTVLISVIPTAPPASKLWKKLRLEPLVASLHLPSAESTAEAVWDQHVLQLTEKVETNPVKRLMLSEGGQPSILISRDRNWWGWRNTGISECPDLEEGMAPEMQENKSEKTMYHTAAYQTAMAMLPFKSKAPAVGARPPVEAAPSETEERRASPSVNGMFKKISERTTTTHSLPLHDIPELAATHSEFNHGGMSSIRSMLTYTSYFSKGVAQPSSLGSINNMSSSRLLKRAHGIKKNTNEEDSRLVNAIAASGMDDSMAGLPHILVEVKVIKATRATARLPELDMVPLETTRATARLPELDMVPLERRAHSYAHGGFMGAAISLVADENWEKILKEEQGDETSKRYFHELFGSNVAEKKLLLLMGALENSPVLCAYGLVRSGCLPSTVQGLGIAGPSNPLTQGGDGGGGGGGGSCSQQPVEHTTVAIDLVSTEQGAKDKGQQDQGPGTGTRRSWTRDKGQPRDKGRHSHALQLPDSIRMESSVQRQQNLTQHPSDSTNMEQPRDKGQHSHALHLSDSTDMKSPTQGLEDHTQHPSVSTNTESPTQGQQNHTQNASVSTDMESPMQGQQNLTLQGPSPREITLSQASEGHGGMHRSPGPMAEGMELPTPIQGNGSSPTLPSPGPSQPNPSGPPNPGLLSSPPPAPPKSSPEPSKSVSFKGISGEEPKGSIPLGSDPLSAPPSGPPNPAPLPALAGSDATDPAEWVCGLGPNGERLSWVHTPAPTFGSITHIRGMKASNSRAGNAADDRGEDDEDDDDGVGVPLLIRTPGCTGVNRYGYRPVSLEWDLWLHPKEPWDISQANVDHGSAFQLVQQALTTALGCHGFAAQLGTAHNKEFGITPKNWLSSFGRSLNQGFTGDAATPLPLDTSKLPSYFRLNLASLTAQGLPASIRNIQGLRMQIRLQGNRNCPKAMSLEKHEITRDGGFLVFSAKEKVKEEVEDGETELLSIKLSSTVAGLQTKRSKSISSTGDGARQMYPVHPYLENSEASGGDLENSELVVEVLAPSVTPDPSSPHVIYYEPLLTQFSSPSLPLQVLAPSVTPDPSSPHAIYFETPLTQFSSPSHPDQVLAPSVRLPSGRVMARAKYPLYRISPLCDASSGAKGGVSKIPALPPQVLAPSVTLPRWRVVARAKFSLHKLITAKPAVNSSVTVSGYAPLFLKKDALNNDVDPRGSRLDGYGNGLMNGGLPPSERPSPYPLTAPIPHEMTTQANGLEDAKYSATHDKEAAPHEGAPGPLATPAAEGSSKIERQSSKRIENPPQLDRASHNQEKDGERFSRLSRLLHIPEGLENLHNSAVTTLKDLTPNVDLLTRNSCHRDDLEEVVEETDSESEDVDDTDAADQWEYAAFCEDVEQQFDCTASTLENAGLQDLRKLHRAKNAVKIELCVESFTVLDAAENILGALCSFKLDQITFTKSTAEAPGAVQPSTIPKPVSGKAAPCDTVLFFHGLNGLEAACESGSVPRNQCVLFNGVNTDSSLPALIDREAWRRYRTLVEVYRIYGGIYVQEPDASPSSVEALVRLTNANSQHLALGFAYGHLRNKAVAVMAHEGRGFAAQQLLEELSAQKRLNNKVVVAVVRLCLLSVPILVLVGVLVDVVVDVGGVVFVVVVVVVNVADVDRPTERKRLPTTLTDRPTTQRPPTDPDTDEKPQGAQTGTTTTDRPTRPTDPTNPTKPRDRRDRPPEPEPGPTDRPTTTDPLKVPTYPHRPDRRRSRPPRRRTDRPTDEKTDRRPTDTTDHPERPPHPTNTTRPDRVPTDGPTETTSRPTDRLERTQTNLPSRPTTDRPETHRPTHHPTDRRHERPTDHENPYHPNRYSEDRTHDHQEHHPTAEPIDRPTTPTTDAETTDDVPDPTSDRPTTDRPHATDYRPTDRRVPTDRPTRPANATRIPTDDRPTTYRTTTAPYLHTDTNRNRHTRQTID
eukprot:gene26400-17497_t